MADDAAAIDEDALAAELADDEVTLPTPAAEEYQASGTADEAGGEEEGGGYPAGGTPASSVGRERPSRRDEYYDEGEWEAEEEESRGRAKKRKLKKEGKQSGGRLTKVRRRGQTDRPDPAADRGGPGLGPGPEGGEERDPWDQAHGDSEDDREGERTREDEEFIDNQGLEGDPYLDEHPHGEDHISSLPQAEEGEEDEIDRSIRRGGGGGGRRKKVDLSDCQKALFVEEFKGKLERAAQDDAEANLRGEPAIHKLRILPELMQTLRKRHLQKEFLDRGVFTVLKNWLEPLPDWSLPNIKIRTAVLQLLGELPIDVANNPERRRQLKESGLGKVVMFLAKLEQEETVQNRMLAKELVDNWSRPIFEKSTHYRDLREQEADRPPRRQTISPVAQPRPSYGSAVDLDDVEGAASQSAGPKEKRMVTRIPQPARMDFTVRPMSKVQQEVVQDVKGGMNTNNPLMKRLAKLKGSGGKGRIARAEKVSVEGRGLRGI